MSEEDDNTNGARNKGNANDAGDTTHKNPNNKNDTPNVADHAGDNDDTSSDEGSDGNNMDDVSHKDSDTPENYAKPCAANSATKLENAEKLDVGNDTDSDTSSARSLLLFAKSQSTTKTEKAARGVKNDTDFNTSSASSLPLSAISRSATEKKQKKGALDIIWTPKAHHPPHCHPPVIPL
jgi:hypothetical protein